MLTPHFADLVHHHFDGIHDAAAFFHVQPITVQRWLSGEVPVNPMAEKLMNIHARGYLPLDHRWNRFRVHFDRATLVTLNDASLIRKNCSVLRICATNIVSSSYASATLGAD